VVFNHAIKWLSVKSNFVMQMCDEDWNNFLNRSMSPRVVEYQNFTL